MSASRTIALQQTGTQRSERGLTNDHRAALRATRRAYARWLHLWRRWRAGRRARREELEETLDALMEEAEYDWDDLDPEGNPRHIRRLTPHFVRRGWLYFLLAYWDPLRELGNFRFPNLFKIVKLFMRSLPILGVLAALGWCPGLHSYRSQAYCLSVATIHGSHVLSWVHVCVGGLVGRVDRVRWFCHAGQAGDRVGRVVLGWLTDLLGLCLLRLPSVVYHTRRAQQLESHAIKQHLLVWLGSAVSASVVSLSERCSRLCSRCVEGHGSATRGQVRCVRYVRGRTWQPLQRSASLSAGQVRRTVDYFDIACLEDWFVGSVHQRIGAESRVNDYVLNYRRRRGELGLTRPPTARI